MKEANKILKEQNIKLRNEITFLGNLVRFNILEQKNVDNFIEIIGVPENKDEDYVKTVENMADELSVKSITYCHHRVSYTFKNHEQT